jgi:hypothetical protein
MSPDDPVVCISVALKRAALRTVRCSHNPTIRFPQMKDPRRNSC